MLALQNFPNEYSLTLGYNVSICLAPPEHWPSPQAIKKSAVHFCSANQYINGTQSHTTGLLQINPFSQFSSHLFINTNSLLAANTCHLLHPYPPLRVMEPRPVCREARDPDRWRLSVMPEEAGDEDRWMSVGFASAIWAQIQYSYVKADMMLRVLG